MSSSSIHYRFRSSSEFDMISFDGPAITVSDLREAIMLQKKIAKSPGHTLEITNAQTKEVYHLDNCMVPKNFSVIVKRVPVQRLEAVTAQTSGLTKEEEELTEIAFAKLTKTADLVNAKASENDKIKAMMRQSTEDFSPSQYVRRAHQGYPCYRCNGKGHFVKDCPTQGDARYNNAQFAPRPPSGIPRAYFMMRMKQEEELIKNLRAMQPANSRFSPVCSSDVVDHTKVPSELQCPMCKKLFVDVVVTPCCGDSFCDECIRNHLVEHDLVCICQETTSPDNLIANKSLRISVSNFRNKKKAEMKSVPPSPVTVTPVIQSNGPFVTNEIAKAVENMIIPIQQPPDLHSESSQSSSITNGLDSAADSDPGLVNSPKKLPPEITDNSNNVPPSNLATANNLQPAVVVSQQVRVSTSTPQVVTSLPVSLPGSQPVVLGSLASQVVPHQFPGNAGQAIYTGVQSSIRPGILLPQQQQHLLPAGVVGPNVPYGITLPPGATIVKRLVPVPVGPRLSPSQIRLAQQAHAMAVAGGMNQRMMDPMRERANMMKPNEKRRGNETESPMTEDEFYLWQQQFKKRTTNTRRRHRSSSRDGSRERERFKSRSRSRTHSRSRSRSPPAEKKRKHRTKDEEEIDSPSRSKKKYESADDSSQERKKKKEKKEKKRHRERETSQESVKSEPPPKPRSRPEKKLKSRELPEHIKREVDEFEFDNELEFDEELRKLRKESEFKKKASIDVEISSPEDPETRRSADPAVRSRSSSFSKPSRSLSPSSPVIQSIEIDLKDDTTEHSPVPHTNNEDGDIPSVENRVETDSLKFSDNEEDKNRIEEVLECHPNDKLETDQATSTVVEDNAEKPSEVKPKKKTKMVKKRVVRIIKVSRKKRKSNSSPTDELGEKTPVTPTEKPIIETTESAHATVETEESKTNKEDLQPNTDNNESIVEIPPPVTHHEQTVPQNIIVGYTTGNNIVLTDSSQPLPENSRWETNGKPILSTVHRKTHDGVHRKTKHTNIDGVVSTDEEAKAERKKIKHSAKPSEKTDGAKMKSSISKEKLLAIKQLHAHKSKMLTEMEHEQMHSHKPKVITEEMRAKKEAEKRALIERAKRAAMEKPKSEGKEGGGEDEERKRKREKYLLLKQKRARERALAERQKAKKMESEATVVKSKIKPKRNEYDDREERIVDLIDTDDSFREEDKKTDHVFYKPGDAKLKTISENTKKRLKQSDGEPKKYEMDDDESGSDVLKSKVTSLKTVIAAAEKRRVIKTSVSEEERELTTPIANEEQHVRRIVKIDDRKKSIVSKVEKLASSTEKSISIRADHEKRRHREEEMERRRREKSLEREREEAIERDRYERRVRLREEENLRREMKEKVRLREIEKERQLREKEEQQRLKSLEKEKLEGLERERLALKEKEKLERKLKRERQLREEMIREKEGKDRKKKEKEDGDKKRHDKRKVVANSDSENSDEHKSSKRSKRDKNKPGYIIQIIDSDQSDSESESSETEDREKKKKKKNKRKREKKKKKRKVDENKSDDKEDSDESSEEEEERKKKKKKKEESEASSDEEDRKKKKRRKHKKKHRKHRKVKKTKKKSKKKKMVKEKSESESEEKQVGQSGDESEESVAKDAKSSTSSEEESVVSSSDTKKDLETGDSSIKTEKSEVDAPEREDPPPSKEKTEEPPTELNNHRSKVKSENSRVERESQVKERSETPRPERDNRNKERSEHHHRTDRDNRNKDKSVENTAERDPRTNGKSEELRSERDSRTKGKSEDHRPERDGRAKGKSEESLSERTQNSSHSKETVNNRSDTSKTVSDTRGERLNNAHPSKDLPKRHDTTTDDLELDYDEDIGDLDDDVLYGDLDFADDEQTNPDTADELRLKAKKNDDDFEDGEILDEELFSAPRKEIKTSVTSENKDSSDTETETETETEKSNEQKTDSVDKIEKSGNGTEPNEIDKAIENAVDDAINELSINIEHTPVSPQKIRRTKSTNNNGTPVVPKRVLRSKKR